LAIVFLNASGPYLSLQVIGELKRSEVAEAQALAAVAAKQWGKVSILVILKDFNGWAQGADWADLVFARDHDHEIEKLAIVGLEEWRDLVYAFRAGACGRRRLSTSRPATLRKRRDDLGWKRLETWPGNNQFKVRRLERLELRTSSALRIIAAGQGFFFHGADEFFVG
jgi:hypothetical protein